MRKSTGNTPTAKKGQKDLQTEKTSGKKLVQARLPFKTLSTGKSPSCKPGAEQQNASGSDVNASETLEARKRKLSYETEEHEKSSENLPSKRSLSKENLEIATKRAKLSTTATSETLEDDVVVLLDDDDSDKTEEQQQEDAARKEPSKAADSPAQRTRKVAANKVKGAGTPKGTNAKSNCSKVQIKLPLSGGKKNKRKKLIQETITAPQDRDQQQAEHSEYSDDIQVLAEELNPQKRLKVEEPKTGLQEKEVIDCISLERDSDVKNPEQNEQNQSPISLNQSLQETEIEPSSSVNSDHAVEPTVMQVDDDSVDGDDDSADSRSSSDVVEMIEKANVLTTDVDSATKSANKTPNVKAIQKKALTPKQIKLNEQRRKAREEKERKLQEERLQKQREKEEKELARKLEREEKDEQRRREREEKDELKRKEREEKERKRLAEIESKNEEKRKRTEAKEEELRKKEEERKRKEQEKEESEIKKKKAAEGFKKFFVPKEARSPADKSEKHIEKVMGDIGASATLAFRPFQIRGDMMLAPICRKRLSTVEREKLDSFLRSETEEQLPGSPTKQLYLSEIQSGQRIVGKWRKPPIDSDVDGSSDDVCIVEDELERAGQAIVEETHIPTERQRVKFYKFHENRRPPYYGTWRKKTSVVKPRCPFAQDKKYFDYEVESDLEWEEEEPGESLDGSDDDKEKESEDDDYEVDNEWFVPHGHLSDEELQNEDECGLDTNNDREAQKAKLQILQQEFAQEMKKKTEKIKPRLLGCIWVDENGNQPELCPKIIWDTLNVRGMLCMVPPMVEEPEEPVEKSAPNSPTAGNTVEKTSEKLKPIALSEERLKDLVRLMHGNSHSKVFLIKEFIAYVEANEEAIKNGGSRGPLKSMVREKIDEYAEWQAVEAKTNSKKKNKKRLCWVVAKEVLEKMQLEELSLHNRWHYTLQPKFTNAEVEQKDSANATEQGEKTGSGNCKQKDTNANAEGQESASSDVTKNTKANSSITKFAKVLTAEEKAERLQQKHVDKKTCMAKRPTPGKNQRSEEIAPVSNSDAPPPAKKRVALLMSVPRGQQFSTVAKNALISQFLTKGTAEPKKPVETTTAATSKQQTDEGEVVVLD